MLNLVMIPMKTQLKNQAKTHNQMLIPMMTLMKNQAKSLNQMLIPMMTPEVKVQVIKDPEIV